MNLNINPRAARRQLRVALRQAAKDLIPSRVRAPVKRHSAERYLLITLLSFASAVALTRLFLELAGYPKLGGGGLHIAHVLWGGLLLFAAALLPLILANRWAYGLSALLAGVGVGLFIDEVGKFITESNDYFYPAAAPIIYAFFLLTVLVYLQVRRPPQRDARSELYRALDDLEEALDHDLEPSERAEVEERLQFVLKQDAPPQFKRLAEELLEFLHSRSLPEIGEELSFWERLQARWEAWASRHLTRERLRAALAAGLALLGLWTLVNLRRFTAVELSASGSLPPGTTLWLWARAALEGGAAAVIVLGAAALTLGRDRAGARLGYYGLLVSLTVVNLLVFYYNQFSTILAAIAQFILLLGAARLLRLANPTHENIPSH